MKSLTVTNVQRIAWDNECVELKSDDVDVIMTIKNPSLHGKIAKGDDIDTLFTGADDEKIAALTNELNQEREAHAQTLEQVNALTKQVEELSKK